jgi:septum site-determining protein MinC
MERKGGRLSTGAQIMGAAITVKGTRNGVLITLGTGDVPDLLTRLTELVDSRNSFFRGGRVALQVGDLRLTLKDLTRMRQALEERGVNVWAIIGTDPTTCAAVEKLNLATDLTPSLPEEMPAGGIVSELSSGAGVLVQRTLRSGQSIVHAGTVVIIGDVNPGAEVIAGGDVIVWGHLRGTVHAGATGEEERSVCALDLSPTQLRIGNLIARPPDGKRRPRDIRPERAFVSDGQIVAERWK